MKYKISSASDGNSCKLSSSTQTRGSRCSATRHRASTTFRPTIGLSANSEVLRVSEKLAAAGIAHRYQRPAADRAVPAWVGMTLRSCESSRLGRTAFDELTAELNVVPPDAWALLKRFDPRGSRDALDVL